MAKHLTLAERECLQRLLKRKRSKAEAAELLGRHRSTIYRELARNSTAFGYRPKLAQRLHEERRGACGRRPKLSDLGTRLYVAERLMKAWSPDQIAGRLRREFPKRPGQHLTAQTIYAWLRRKAVRYRRWLRHGSPRPVKAKKKPDCVRLRGRPDVINHRRRYGDWEGDTVLAPWHRNGLLTLVERKSGVVKIDKLADLRSETTMRACRLCLGKLPPNLRRSVTFDNGSEFSHYAILAKQLAVAVYFADPYSAWQRGSNENVNGLVRQFFPKGTDFANVTRREAKRIEQLLNERPRRRFNYQTPLEVLQQIRCRN
jgi:transposase, IS30 family